MIDPRIAVPRASRAAAPGGPALTGVQPAVVHDERAVDGEVGPVVGGGAEGVGPRRPHLEPAPVRRREPVRGRARDGLLELDVAVEVDRRHVRLANVGEGADVGHGAEGLALAGVGLHEPLAVLDTVLGCKSPLPAPGTGLDLSKKYRPDSVLKVGSANLL
jgi:hypothetical protein